MSRSSPRLVSIYQPPDYFDLTTREVSEIEIKEKGDKSTCLISLTKDSGTHFKGFKLSDKPQVNVCVDVVFFPSTTSGKYIPRLTFHKVDNTFTTKEQKGKEKVIIDLDDSTTAENFWKVIGFLFSFKDLVEHGEFEKSYKVVDNKAYVVEFDSKERAEKIQVLSELVEKSDFSEHQIEEILKQDRENTLEGFRRLLSEPEIIGKYREKYKDEIKGVGEEAVWHHFLKKHHWLLGLNADLRFIQDLIPEGNVGIASTEDRGSPNADFIGIRDFTMLVEVKTPKTKIFSARKKSTARANTWSFSDDFIDGVSQCLGQKFSWDKSSGSKNLVVNGGVLDQNKTRTIDPKVIYLIGNRSEEFPEDSTNVDNLTKRDTFERFRRNSRNVEILTFDELYERAYYIVHNKAAAASAPEIMAKENVSASATAIKIPAKMAFDRHLTAEDRMDAAVDPREESNW
jgi:hypothetical protein